MNKEDRDDLKIIRETQLIDATKMSDLLSHYKDLKEDLEESRKETNEIKKSVDKIYMVLCDDNKLGVVGIGSQVKLNTKFREDVKSKLAVFGFMGGATAAGVIVSVWQGIRYVLKI